MNFLTHIPMARITLAALAVITMLTPAMSQNAEDEAPRKKNPRWEAAMEKFDAIDAETSPPQHGIVFVGSSSIVGWDVEKSFPNMPVINRGFGGSITLDVLEYFDRIIVPYNPKIVVFYSGDNDINRGMHPEVVASHVREFITRIHENVPSVERIILIPPKPSISRIKKWPQMKAVGAVQQAMADQYEDVVFIDIAPAMMDFDGTPRKELFKKDNLHLSQEGYDVWNELLLPHLDLGDD